MRRLPLGLLLCALLALAFAGCGGSGKSTPTAATGPDPASVAPADTAIYGEVLVRPGGDVERGVVVAARKVSRVTDPGAELRKLIDKALARGGNGDTYANDVEPWLGARAGFFLLAPAPGADPDFAIAFAVRDQAALRSAIARWRSKDEQRPDGTYRGVAYDRETESSSIKSAIVGDLYVGGTLDALRAAIDASKGSALADVSRYDDAVERLDPDRLAFAYVDPRVLLPALARAPTTSPQLRQLLSQIKNIPATPATLELTARADEIALTLDGEFGAAGLNVDADGPQVSVNDMPGDAWAAFATPPLGPILKRIVEQAGVHDVAAAQVRQMTGLDLDTDILEPLGGLAGFARGTGPLDIGGGIVLRMRDAASAEKLLNRVQAIATSAGGSNVNPAPGGGFDVLVPRLPQPIVVQSKDDKIAAGYAQSSTDDLLAPKTHFDESPAGKAAIATLGEGYTPSLVVIMPPVVQLLTSLQDIDVADFSSVLPYLSAYRSLAVGTKHDGDRTTVRIVAALK